MNCVENLLNVMNVPVPLERCCSSFLRESPEEVPGHLAVQRVTAAHRESFDDLDSSASCWDRDRLVSGLGLEEDLAAVETSEAAKRVPGTVI